MPSGPQKDGAKEPSPALDALPFHVLLWVAGADDEIEPEEVEVFHKMLDRRTWCRSKAAHEVFPRTAAAYASLWKKHGAQPRDLAPIRAGLREAARVLPEADLALFKADLARIADSVARAAGGFLGLGAVNFHEQTALRALNEALAEAPSSASEPARAPSIAPPGPARWTQGRIELRCASVRDETSDVKTFRFEPADGSSVHFEYLPGQFVTVELPIEGKTVLRSYSISSSPSRPDALELTVKRVPGGLASNWLHDHMRAGMRVAVRGPAGKFTCGADPGEKLLLLSAGSGVTPVMSMSRYLRDTGKLAKGSARDVVFFHSARTLADVPFHNELRALCQEHPSFRLVVALTRVDPRAPYDGPVGRLSEQMLLARVPDYRKRTVYVCGPTPFMETTREVLAGLGFPMERYFAESFGGSAPATPSAPPRLRRSNSLADLLPAPSAPLQRPEGPKLVVLGSGGERVTTTPSAEVHFARSGRSVGADAESTILELAEQVGVRIANACRSGVCGTCKVKLEQGHEALERGCSDGLSEHDEASGHVLACTAKARSRVVIDA